ncbi:MAG: S8 family serine peptidase, partial [Bacteroidota bacterium]
MKNSASILVILLLSSFVKAQDSPKISQVNRYFIYFTDKASETYPYSIAKPDTFLTQRAIERRTEQGITISENDLPVDPSYVQGLKDVGADVYFTSKWLNGALANIDTALLDDIDAFSFVDSIAWIADTTRLSRNKETVETPTTFVDPPSVNGNSDIQLAMLGADHMHADNIKGKGIRIAVLDNGFTGVNKFTPFQHLWEENRIIATKDFVQNSGNVFQSGAHGTSVFSIISSNYESENDNLVGIAPEAEFILCITEDDAGENTVEEYNWLLGAEFADSLGVDIINASLGYNTFD